MGARRRGSLRRSTPGPDDDLTAPKSRLYGRRWAQVWARIVLVLLAVAGPLEAQTTSYVPVQDWAYHELDALASLGLVPGMMAGERPYSVLAVSRFVAEARRLASQVSVPARAMEAMERLEARFGPPAVTAGATPAQARVRSVRLLVSTADAPDRDLRPGRGGVRIDGTLNPLLERNGGRVLESDGWTSAGEVTVDVTSGMFAAAVTPRLVGYGRGGGPGETDLTMFDGYARARFGSLSVAVGRNHVVQGHGRGGGPMLSDNARGLDMVRVSNEYPVRLPGFLSGLGLWQTSALLADMGDDRDVPGSKLTLLRVGYRPGRLVEFGVSYLNHQGGQGAPEATLGERFSDVFLFWLPFGSGEELQISDKVVEGDVLFTIPALRTQLYLNVLTTFVRDGITGASGGLWEDAIWSAGAKVSGLGPGGRSDVWAEWRHAGAEPHTHWQFSSGLTLDGRVIGDPLGPNASGVQGGVDWNSTPLRISVWGAWERYSGDIFKLSEMEGRDDKGWVVKSENPDEIRTRIMGDFVHRAGVSGLETSVRLGYEHVTRFDFDGPDRSNYLAQVSLAYFW
jgi:capsule assembly protein Wzi